MTRLDEVSRLGGKWHLIVRSTWRAYLVFGFVGLLAVGGHYGRGGYEGMNWDEIVGDAIVVLSLMFVASFITSLLFHYQIWRNSRWPGGGGPRNR